MSITWNGVSSDTIGVIVERIPNRYVPTRRFSPQQVAGRNGNILLVDKSFPNVEQEYEVYLSAEAQGLPSVARACAEWLMGPDGYCRLQDSYDTTVYREAFLMGGYDLENILNKFGRCTITFSCKPQKYLLTGDTPISIPAGTTTTYTGSSVQCDGITGASITSLSTTITPTQDLHGYDAPWPAGGGKNLLPLIDGTYAVGSTGATAVVSDGSITITGTTTAGGGRTTRLSSYFTLKAGTYIVSPIQSTTPYVRGYINKKSDGTALGYSSGNAITVAEDTEVYYGIGIESGQTYDVTVKPQVEAGSTITTWVPYSNICPITGRTGLSVYVSPTQDPDDATVYNVDWTTQAGTVYSGTVDVVTGVLTVDRVCETITKDSAWLSFSTGTGNSSAAVYLEYYQNCKYVDGASSSNGAISSTGKEVPNYWTAARPNEAPGDLDMCFAYSYTGFLRFHRTDVANITDLNAFKAAFPDTQICYYLATPITYQLTAQEIGVLIGTNYVWLSAGGVSLTVTTPLGGIVTNPTPFEARPMLEVSGVGEITINGKSIQILESVSDFLIDCEAMEAEDNSKIYCMDFPELSGGENEIVGDGSITALTVTPRWWTL